MSVDDIREKMKMIPKIDVESIRDLALPPNLDIKGIGDIAQRSEAFGALSPRIR